MTKVASPTVNLPAPDLQIGFADFMARGEGVFLQQALLAYYRLVYGFSQKKFYLAKYGTGALVREQCFKAKN